jgi:hypothetical protein
VPTDGLDITIRRLIAAGITSTEVNIMTKQNPARFLGLP